MWRALLTALLAWASLACVPVASAEQPVRLARGGAIEMAGRQVRCDRVRLELDRHLDNLGAAAPDDRLLVLNPRLLGNYSKTVQLFVFHHECGHHRVGESELKADCWAVDRGVHDGWLDRNGLAQVCRSFANAPETDTHPSGRRRCANIDQCFAAAELAVAREKKDAEKRIAALTAVTAARPLPKLVSKPTLVRDSMLAY
ncbi:MAG: hypothetical protein AB7L90_09880 [Hyphomicrobiaceae bacterium]